MKGRADDEKVPFEMFHGQQRDTTRGQKLTQQTHDTNSIHKEERADSKRLVRAGSEEGKDPPLSAHAAAGCSTLNVKGIRRGFGMSYIWSTYPSCDESTDTKLSMILACVCC